MLKFPRKEKEFNKYLVREYFMCGSVDEVLRKHSYGLPISYANYQRILDYITPDFVHILANGQIVKSGDQKLPKQIELGGYEQYLT